MKKDNMRVIATVMGEADSSVRNNEVASMLDYAFSKYKLEKLLSTDSVIKKEINNKAKVKNIEIVPKKDVTILLEKKESITPTYDIKINKLKLPIKKGDIIGKLIVKDNSNILEEVDLTVNKDIKRANILELYLRYLKDIMSGNIKI